MKWFAGTAAGSALLFAIFGFVGTAVAAQDIAGAIAAANAAGADLSDKMQNPDAVRTQVSNDASNIYFNKVKPQYGSGSAANTSGVEPLTRGTSLKSINGSSVGVVQVLKPNDKPLLKITLEPNFSTGDFAKLTIQQDLDGDGLLEINSVHGELGHMISGVCSNGMIMCQPGTYSSCVFVKWATEASGKVVPESLITGEPTINRDLFNCYCFNNFCSRFNNTSAVNYASISSDIAGGIVSVFMGARADLSITSVSASDTVLSYFGVKAPAASSAEGFTAPAKPSTDPAKIPVITGNTPDIAVQYYTDPNILNSMAAEENALMGTKPNSLYSLIRGMPNSASLMNCQKRRIMTVSQKTQYCDEPKSPAILDFKETTTYFKISTTGSFHNRDHSRDMYRGYLTTDGHNQEVMPSDFPWQADNATQITSEILASMQYMHAVSVRIVENCNYTGKDCNLFGDDCDFYYSCQISQYYSQCERVYDEFYEFENNGCASLEADEAAGKCRLQNETWDVRPAVTNFTPTGFAMAETSEQVAGTSKVYQVSRPWWTIDRTYTCSNNRDTSYDSYLNSVQDQVKQVQDSAVTPATVDLSARCQEACKTKIPVSNTLVRTLSVESELKTSAAVQKNSWDYYVKVCEPDATNTLKCPIDAGLNEVIVKDCQCLNEYGTVAAGFEALKTAGDDAICSSRAP